MTLLDLFTKYLMGLTLEAFIVVTLKGDKAYDGEEFESLDVEILFLSNQMGCSQPTCQRQC